MPKGMLLPIPRVGMTPAASAKLFTYQPGTTTKQTTYSDSDLTTANANPLSAGTDGLFGSVYIDPALGYKIVIHPSTETNDPPTGTPLVSQDNAWLPANHVDPLIAQGRLTLTSATPVTTSDVTAATTVYFTPYCGSAIALYNTTKSAWEVHTFTEVSLSLVGLTASTPYDLFLYDNAGTKTLESVAWSSATARATALATQNGVYVKNGSANKRYVGTVFINSSGGQTDDTQAKRYLYNEYNQRARDLFKTDTTDSWTYTTATFRQANNATANKVEVMTGNPGHLVDLSVIAHAANTNTGVGVNSAIGVDSTTTPHANMIGGRTTSALANAIGQVGARVTISPAIGLHAYNWLEFSEATGTTTWYGDNGGGANSGTKSGLSGVSVM